MSTDENNKSVIEYLKNNENRDSIQDRIGFVMRLLEDNKLEPLINFDRTDTDNFTGGSKDDLDSNESFDTRVVLRKQVHDITDVIDKMGGTLTYKKSGSTGHTFQGTYSNSDTGDYYEYAVKVVPYSIKGKYGDMYDIGRPENAELQMIKLLSYFIVNKKTPHIILPIGTFDTDIENFTNLIEDGIISESSTKYSQFVEKYKKGEYYDKVSILISEWANRGDFLDYIKNNFDRFTPTHWKVFFFQIISTLAVIQAKYKSFRHNDMKANNILVTKINSKMPVFTYTITRNVYKVPNIGYQLKLWDFDFACIPGHVNNKKVTHSNKWSRSINVGPTQNRYYDIHFFFNTLMMDGFFPEIMTHSLIPDEVKEFVTSIVPKEYRTGGDFVAKKGRITKNVEYTTPEEILRTNPYFEEFRIENIKRAVKPVKNNNSSGSNKFKATANTGEIEKKKRSRNTQLAKKNDIAQELLIGGNDPGIRISESIRELDMRSKSRSKDQKNIHPQRDEKLDGVKKYRKSTQNQLDKSTNHKSRSKDHKSRSKDHKSRSKDHKSRSKDHKGGSKDHKSRSKDHKGRSKSHKGHKGRSNSHKTQSKDNKSRSKNNKSRSKNNKSRSKNNKSRSKNNNEISKSCKDSKNKRASKSKSIDDINIYDILLGVNR
jgi:hypothetical protein